MNYIAAIRNLVRNDDVIVQMRLTPTASTNSASGLPLEELTVILVVMEQ